MWGSYASLNNESVIERERETEKKKKIKWKSWEVPGFHADGQQNESATR